MYDVTTSSSTTKTTQLTYADITHPLSASSHIRTHTERKRVMESWPAAMWLHTLSGGLMKLFVRSMFSRVHSIESRTWRPRTSAATWQRRVMSHLTPTQHHTDSTLVTPY